LDAGSNPAGSTLREGRLENSSLLSFFTAKSLVGHGNQQQYIIVRSGSKLIVFINQLFKGGRTNYLLFYFQSRTGKEFSRFDEK